MPSDDAYYEDDEDPASIHAAFEKGKKHVTARPIDGAFLADIVNVDRNFVVKTSFGPLNARHVAIASSAGTASTTAVASLVAAS